MHLDHVHQWYTLKPKQDLPKGHRGPKRRMKDHQRLRRRVEERVYPDPKLRRSKHKVKERVEHPLKADHQLRQSN